MRVIVALVAAQCQPAILRASFINLVLLITAVNLRFAIFDFVFFLNNLYALPCVDLPEPQHPAASVV